MGGLATGTFPSINLRKLSILGILGFLLRFRDQLPLMQQQDASVARGKPSPGAQT